MKYIPVTKRKNSFMSGDKDAVVADIMGSIGKLESSDNYQAIGPETKSGDVALGKYQIMDKMNLANWSREALGREVSRDEFLSNPEIQDEIARYKMGQYYDKYGNKEDVASAWFTGRPVAEAGLDVADVTGTTNAKYQEMFKSNLQKRGGYIPLASRR